jgi:hypothetical protein
VGIVVKKLHLVSLVGARARLFVLPAPDNTRTPTAAFSHPQAINNRRALITALAICGVLTAISLLVPPFMDNDSSDGFLAWRGTLTWDGKFLYRA